MKTLQEIQAEIGAWSREQFGDNVSKVTGHPLFSQNALTGLVEEVGELNHVTICHHQGRRGYDSDAKYEVDRNDALADILVFMCDYACREDVDLLTVLNETWDKIVSKRTVANWEQHTHDTPTGVPSIDECLLVALSYGWSIDPSDKTLHLKGDASENWAAIWIPVRHTTVEGVAVRVPDWLPRRLQELGHLTIVEQPQQTGQGWAEPPLVVEPDASFGDGLVRAGREITPGPACVAERYEDPNYARLCLVCDSAKVHVTNSVQVCGDCYPRWKQNQGAK